MTKAKRYAIVGGALLIFGLGLSLAGTRRTLAQAGEECQKVRICNTVSEAIPVLMQGITAISGDVRVTAPVPIDSSDRTPVVMRVATGETLKSQATYLPGQLFQRQTQIFMPPPMAVNTDSFVASPTSILQLHGILGQLTLPLNGVAASTIVSLTTTANNVTAKHILPKTFAGVVSVLGGGAQFWSLNWQGTIYADPGSQIIVKVEIGGTPNGAALDVTLTGTLVS